MCAYVLWEKCAVAPQTHAQRHGTARHGHPATERVQCSGGGGGPAAMARACAFDSGAYIEFKLRTRIYSHQGRARRAGALSRSSRAVRTVVVVVATDRLIWTKPGPGIDIMSVWACVRACVQNVRTHARSNPTKRRRRQQTHTHTHARDARQRQRQPRDDATTTTTTTTIQARKYMYLLCLHLCVRARAVVRNVHSSSSSSAAATAATAAAQLRSTNLDRMKPRADRFL